MRIKRDVKTLEEHRVRYKKAIERVFDVKEIMFAEGIRPGECPENVFDFQEGLRLIISRDSVNGDEWLHASVSFAETKFIEDILNDVEKDLEEGGEMDVLLSAMYNVLMAVSSRNEWEVIDITDKGIVHWGIKLASSVVV